MNRRELIKGLLAGVGSLIVDPKGIGRAIVKAETEQEIVRAIEEIGTICKEAVRNRRQAFIVDDGRKMLICWFRLPDKRRMITSIEFHDEKINSLKDIAECPYYGYIESNVCKTLEHRLYTERGVYDLFETHRKNRRALDG